MSYNENGTPFTMPVAPVGYGGNGGFGFGGDNAWWIVLFLIFGWGNNGWGNGGFGGMNGGVGSEVQRGFDHSATVTKLDGITQGICDSTYALNNTMTNGFHGVDNAICNLGYQTQQGFNNTNVALMQGQNALASQLAQCCCDNQRAIDGVNYNLATQSCETRHAIQDSTRQILDFLTTDKISTLQAENQALKTQNYIAANQDAQTAELLRRLTPPAPVPAWQVPNPFASYGCGNPCGC